MLAVTGGVPGNSPMIILSGISESPQASLSPHPLLCSARKLRDHEHIAKRDLEQHRNCGVEHHADFGLG